MNYNFNKNLILHKLCNIFRTWPRLGVWIWPRWPLRAVQWDISHILDLDGFKIEFTTVDFSIIRLFKYIAVINSANKSSFHAIQKQKYFQCNPRSVKKDRHNQGPSDDGTASFRGRPLPSNGLWRFEVWFFNLSFMRYKLYHRVWSVKWFRSVC